MTAATPQGSASPNVVALDRLEAGMLIPFGGNRAAVVDPDLAAAFQPGDRLVVVNSSGALLHIAAAEYETATAAVGKAHDAFGKMGAVTDEAITEFFGHFAHRLEDDASFAAIAAANAADIAAAKARGRSTTRLELTDSMRADMISGLRSWAQAPGGRGAVQETVTHEGWTVELIRSGLGVVGFVFEGRPNVFADACGVIRSGNTVVFRIGSDALGTAQAIVKHALDPALAAAGLPEGAASLVESQARSAGWAMFSDPRLALAVARGSGAAVEQLGAVARQSGIAVSLHGTGGAWIVAASDANPTSLEAAISASLDRKVCNTVNTVVLTEGSAAAQIDAVLGAVRAAADARNAEPKLHVTAQAQSLIPVEWFEAVPIDRAEGAVTEPRVEPIAEDGLGTEWEWENSPEMSIAVVADTAAAAELCNRWSPHFVVSLISPSQSEHDSFFAAVDAPFVGNGFTRWVDGQYALDRPELGLSNWESGRLFGRGGVLSGDSVYTLRTRATQTDPNQRR